MKLKLVALLLITSVSLSFGQGQKTAFVTSTLVIEKMPEFHAAQQKMEIRKVELQQALEKEEKDLQGYYQETIQKVQNGELSPTQQQEAEAKLQKMQEDLQIQAEKAKSELQGREAEMLKELQEKFTQAVKLVAERKGYDYVVDANTVFYANPANDITNDVLAQLGIK